MSRNKRLCYEGNAHNQSINRDELIGFTLTGDTLNGILMNVIALVTGTHVANPTRIWWRDWNRSSWNWRGNRTSSLLAIRPSYAAFWPIFSTKLQVCISPSSFIHIQSANRVDLVIDNSSGRLISSIKSIKTVWFLLTLSFIHPYFINWLFSWLVNHFKWIGSGSNCRFTSLLFTWLNELDESSRFHRWIIHLTDEWPSEIAGL